jgi:hypothetical protein
MPIVGANRPHPGVRVSRGERAAPTMSQNLLRSLFFVLLLALILYVAFGGGM